MEVDRSSVKGPRDLASFSIPSSFGDRVVLVRGIEVVIVLLVI